MTEPAGKPLEEETLRAGVRDHYGEIARSGGCCGSAAPGPTAGCCGGSSGSDCGCGTPVAPDSGGYSAEDLERIPEGANLGLGCGNPTGLASLRSGEVVLDLGSGAGVDCFLAASKVGPTGRVIGVDMTPAMVSRARGNGRRSGVGNVEFRLGEIEHLPVADRSVDVIISNCVINLAPDKGAVYREAFRVLRPGGRLAISDVVATRPISVEERNDLVLWSSCSSGALAPPEIRTLLTEAGFSDIEVELRGPGPESIGAEGSEKLGVFPADIRARRPD